MVSERQAYALRHLPRTLHASGWKDRVEEILTRYSFLRDKTQGPGPGALVADYDLLPENSPLRQVQDALRLSLQVLISDPAQLGGQLLGRLLGRGGPEEALARLLAAARLEESGPRLLPRTGSLAPPGGALLQTIDRRPITALAVSPDGARAAVGARGGSVKIWDIEAGALLFSFAAHLDRVQAVAVVAGGLRAISASQDGMLAVWDLEVGKLERQLIGGGGAIESLAATPDGRTAVTGMADGAVEVWDLEAGQPVRELLGHSARVLALAIDPAGRRAVAGAEDSTLRCWDVESGAVQVLAGHEGPVHAVLVTRDGRHALSGAQDETIKLWDLGIGEELATLRGHSAPVLSLAFCANERYAVSGAFDGIRLWDIRSRTEVLALPGVRCSFVSSLPQERRVLAANPLRVWDLERARHAEPQDLASGILAMTEDGRLALRGTSSGEVEVWDVASCTKLRTFHGHDRSIRAVSVTPEGRLAISGAADGTLKLWDLERGIELRDLPRHHGGVVSIAVVQGGQRMVTGDGQAELRGWSLPDGEEIASWPLPRGHLSALAVAPDGRYAVVGLYLEGDEEPNQVWDLKAGRQVQTLRGHPEAIDAVVITPNGQRAVTGSLDATLRVWEIESGRELLRIEAFEHQARGLAVSRDGDLLASAADDSTVRVWDLQTGAPIATFTCESNLSSVAFTPDGKTLVAAGLNGALHFLEIRLSHPAKPSAAPSSLLRAATSGAPTS